MQTEESVAVLGCPNRIIRAARKIQILFLFGYNLYWQCVEKRKTAFVGALRNGDDPSVFEKSRCGKPGDFVHEHFLPFLVFRSYHPAFLKRIAQKNVVCLAQISYHPPNVECLHRLRYNTKDIADPDAFVKGYFEKCQRC